MKKLSLLLLMSSTLLLSSDYSLQFGYKTTAYDYTETTPAGILDTEKSELGEINGVYLGLTKRLWSNDYNGDDAIEFIFSHTEGDTDYVGSLLGTGQPYGSYTSLTANTYNDVQLNFKRSISSGDLGFSFLVGTGYYSWERTLSISQVETYHWNYVQAGVGVSTALNKDWTIGVDILGQYAFNQEMDANIPGTVVATFDLGKTYTMKAGVPLTLAVSDTVDFTARLEYEYTEIGKSNVVSGFYEPDSEQKNWNMYLGVNLRF